MDDILLILSPFLILASASWGVRFLLRRNIHAFEEKIYNYIFTHNSIAISKILSGQFGIRLYHAEEINRTTRALESLCRQGRVALCVDQYSIPDAQKAMYPFLEEPEDDE